MFAIILFSCLLLFAPLVLSIVRFTSAGTVSQVMYFIAMLLCIPLIAVWADILGLPLGLGGNGDGWKEMQNLVVTAGLALVANVVFWLGRWKEKPATLEHQQK